MLCMSKHVYISQGNSLYSKRTSKDTSSSKQHQKKQTSSMRPFGKYLRVNRILRFAIYIQNTLFEENNIEFGLSKTIYLIARTIVRFIKIYTCIKTSGL